MSDPLSNSSLVPVPLRSVLAGRLRNITGGRPRHWLMAVAEAIQNALDAIEQSGRRGKTEVVITRAPLLVTDDSAVAPIIDVSVRDTGVGFNAPNFESFCTPDSLHKQNKGGKGLGRLVCLQTFERVEGRSCYQNGSGVEIREFRLQREQPEISQRVDHVEKAEYHTEIKLRALRTEFESQASITTEAIVEWLTEHFLPSLLDKPAWLESLTLIDGAKSVDLTARVSGGALWREDFEVGTYEFKSACYRSLREGEVDQVRLVAGGRIVDANTRPLEHYLPHLHRVEDEENHVVLVRSPFFDEHVNDARNGVSFCEDGEENALLGLTAPQFRENLSAALMKRLGGRKVTVESKLRQRVEEVVRQDAPYYHPLLEGYFISREFHLLSISARDDEILASLDLYKRKSSVGLRKESRRLARLRSETAEYAESARELAEKVEMQKKVALAEYVSLRRIVLDRLQDILNTQSDGRAHLEKEIHNLIFPQRTDTERPVDLPHQLWILDERLESHSYLGSDQPVNGENGDRPDLLVAFNRPGMFASDSAPKAKGYERIALVEFKRALSDLANIPTDDLPHRQMMRYASQLSEGSCVHYTTKRPIKTTADVRYYMYAVCEVSDELLKRLRRDENFTPSPTGDGAFAVLNDGRYYVEYISLPKLLEDAVARNSAFFRRLGLDGV